MKLTNKEKEDITDDVIESRDVEEDDLTTAYLKGYADAEEKYRKRIKELEEEIIYTIIDYKIPRATNNGYYYDYFIKQEYKNDFVKLFNKLLEDK